MSKRDVIESFDTITEQYQDELEENAVGAQNLHGDVITSQRQLNWHQQALIGQHSMPCSATSVNRTPIAGLSPIQNEWIRRYTRPGSTVNLPLWAEQQPENFSLEYLLCHALENGWDLTVVGWDKAYEFGVAQRFEEPDSDPQSEYEGWLRNKYAAEELRKNLKKGGISKTLKQCKVLLCKEVARKKLNTNGIKGRGSLYDPIGVDALALKIRNIGLPDGDEDDEDEY